MSWWQTLIIPLPFLPSSHSQLARRCAARTASGRGRFCGNSGGVRRMVSWCLSAQATDRGDLPEDVRPFEGHYEDGPRCHRVHAGAAWMGRDLEGTVCRARNIQVHNFEKSNAEPAREPSRVARQYVDPWPDAGAAVENRLQSGLGQSVSK